ncbi:hypothetical protein [Sphingobium sp.]|uniref:hypothetical protein n=1 Tax=Sphingobium sp. TaxID=1912891 RepID=UPI0028BDC263|nr:hypothetical protein [Sphingobium sp.]
MKLAAASCDLSELIAVDERASRWQRLPFDCPTQLTVTLAAAEKIGLLTTSASTASAENLALVFGTWRARCVIGDSVAQSVES